MQRLGKLDTIGRYAVASHKHIATARAADRSRWSERRNLEGRSYKWAEKRRLLLGFDGLRAFVRFFWVKHVRRWLDSLECRCC